MDLLWGSRGTKGQPGGGGWSQRGILVDFIGQVTTPSKLHLVLLDLLISISQFLTLLVSFAITLPSDLDAAASTLANLTIVPTTTTRTTNATTTTAAATVGMADSPSVVVTQSSSGLEQRPGPPGARVGTLSALRAPRSVATTMATTTTTRTHDPLAELRSSVLRASGGTEAARDYFGLLGLHEQEDDFDDEEDYPTSHLFPFERDVESESKVEDERYRELGGDVRELEQRGAAVSWENSFDTPQRSSQTKTHTHGEDGYTKDEYDREREDDDFALDVENEKEKDERGRTGDSYDPPTSKPNPIPSSSSMPIVAMPSPERVPFEPIAKLRFRHVWNEIKPGSFRESFERSQVNELRNVEEGR